jgi:hypothetical protein
VKILRWQFGINAAKSGDPPNLPFDLAPIPLNLVTWQIDHLIWHEFCKVW